MKKNKTTIPFCLLLAIASRCFSKEAYFLCFLSVMPFFIYWHISRVFAEDIGALAGVTLGKRGEHLYFMSHEFISWNDNSTEKSIHRKQETSDTVRWAEENRPDHSHRLNWKKALSYISESTLICASSSLCSSFYLSPLIKSSTWIITSKNRN